MYRASFVTVLTALSLYASSTANFSTPMASDRCLQGQAMDLFT